MSHAVTRRAASRSVLLHTPIVAVAALLYITVLHYIYQHHISPDFSYLQYTYRQPEALRYALAIALAVGLAVALPRQIARPSQFVAWVLFILAVVPSIVVPQFARALAPSEATTVAFWVSGSFLLVAVLGTRRALVEFVPRLHLSRIPFWSMIVAIAMLGDAYVLSAVGSHLSLPSINDVYGVRDEFKSVLDGDTALGYIAPLMANIINPLMMIRGLSGRRWPWMAAGLLGQLLIYAASGNKSAVFLPAAIFLTYLWFRTVRHPAGSSLLLGGVGVALTMTLLDLVSRSNDWTSLIVRRFIVTPGLLTAGYVQVFSDIEKARLGHSFLSSIYTYPYQVDPPDLVGSQFFGNPDTHANANPFADGFANFGYPGMLLECLVLVALLWVIDDATRGLPVAISSLLFFMPALALVDGSVFTWPLTDGVLAAIVLAACMPRTGWAVPRRREVDPSAAHAPRAVAAGTTSDC